MRKVVIMAVAAGLVLPATANAQRGPDDNRNARSQGQVQPTAHQRATSPEWNARLAAREAYQQQQRQEARREARDDRRDDRRDARQDRREDRRDYRQDRRQNYRDWQAYRQADRNAFRRGAYVAPRGHRYRAVRVGARLSTNLFWGSRYWINARDYYLPQPRYGYQRYIRYGNDVLLVDTRNGRVLQVYSRFFW